MSNPKNKIFLSYAREDLKIAQRLYNDLKRKGLELWFDREDLLPGQNWEEAINQAISNCSYFLALLSSNSLSKRGYIQKELKMALDILDEYPPSKVYIIPVRLDECMPSDRRLQSIHWADLFPSYEEGLKKTLRVLLPEKRRAEEVTDHLTYPERVESRYQEREAPLEQQLSRPSDESALSAFYQLSAYRHMKNGIYYFGAGGVGKTWLLKKILLDNQNDPARVATDIIDFFDTSNRTIRGLQDSIRARMQTPEAFELYDRARGHLSEAYDKVLEVYPSEIARLNSRANELFIECCQKAASGREVILLFDTFEQVQNLYVGQWLFLEFFPQVRNLLIVVAGRPRPAPARVPSNFVFYELKGLNLRETREYVRRHLPAVSEEVVRGIWEHTSGAPLLINLIIDLPQPRRERFIAEMSKLESGQLVKDSPYLQRALVSQFAAPTRTNRIVWVMAYLARRFDIQMLKYIVESGEWFSSVDYSAIYDELSQSAYIKEYPKLQTHLLHDEVQRIVSEYILDEVVDPWREMRDPLYDLIVNHYYPEAIAAADLELARQLQSEQLGYILDSDPPAGLERYQVYRREVDNTHDYNFEELLWSEVNEHLRCLEQGERFQICLDRAEWLRRHSLFQRAESLSRQMITLFPNRVVEIMQFLGLMLMRQGKFAEAERITQESRSLVNGDDLRSIGMIENVLGQVARQTGRWAQAMKHYAKSLRAATLVNDYVGMATVYINRGYLYSQQGLSDVARQQCKRAIELLGSLPESPANTRHTIYAWLNLGTAYCYSYDYPKAEEHYQKGLELAHATYDREAVCDTLQHIGANEHLWGKAIRENSPNHTYAQRQKKLGEACGHQLRAWQVLVEALEIARETDWRNAIANALNFLAKIYREVECLQNQLSQFVEDREVPDTFKDLQSRGASFRIPFEVEYEHELLVGGSFDELDLLGKATRLFELSALVADEVNDFHLALESLMNLSEVLTTLSMENEARIVVRRIERIKGYDYQGELFAAMSQMMLADLDYKQQRFEAALEKYKKAYADLAGQSGYAKNLLSDRLKDLEQRLQGLAPELILRWCDVLEKEWLERSLGMKRPDMLDLIEHVRLEAMTA